MFRKFMRDKKLRLILNIIGIIISALLQTFAIQTFMKTANLLSSGFTGISMLINKISNLFNFDLSISICMVLLNVPVAIICYKRISKRFTILSLIQVFLCSIFLKIFDFTAIFDDDILNSIFGGALYGLSVVIALKSSASTGGTDFIALFISNKSGKSIWNEVFFFNVFILCIFGAIFGWEYAGYSILFQFVSTKMISTFHQRYTRLTMQITTTKSKEIIEIYIKEYKHGLSCVESMGGYSKKDMQILYTVVSSYEVEDIINLCRQIDKKVIINILKTEKFHGGFYQKPIE